MAMSNGERNNYVSLMTSTENAGRLMDPLPSDTYYNYENAMEDVAESTPTRLILKALFCALHAGNWVYERIIAEINKYQHKDSTFVSPVMKDGLTVKKTDTLNTVGTGRTNNAINQYMILSDYAGTADIHNMCEGKVLSSGTWNVGDVPKVTMTEEENGARRLTGTTAGLSATGGICSLNLSYWSSVHHSVYLEAGHTYYFTAGVRNSYDVRHQTNLGLSLYNPTTLSYIARECEGINTVTPGVSMSVDVRIDLPANTEILPNMCIKPTIIDTSKSNIGVAQNTYSYASPQIHFSDGRMEINGRTNVIRERDWTSVSFSNHSVGQMNWTNTPPIVTTVNDVTVRVSQGSGHAVTRIVQSSEVPNAAFINLEYATGLNDASSSDMYVIDFYQVVCSDPNDVYQFNDKPGSRGEMTATSTHFCARYDLDYSMAFCNYSFILPQLSDRHSCSFIIAHVHCLTTEQPTATFQLRPYLYHSYIDKAYINPVVFGDFELDRSALNGTDTLL